MQRKWDATREKVGVKAFDGASLQSQCDFLELCVSSLRVIVSWESWPSVCADLVCPPVAVTSPSAANLHSALWRHPVIADLIKDLRILQQAAAFSFETHEVDGASGNDKLHWYVALNEMPARTMTFKLRCANHSEHLITGSLINLQSLDYLANMFATTKFLNVNGHFLRLLQSASKFVEMPGAPGH